MTHRTSQTRLLQVDPMTRVEGEGALRVRMRGDEVIATELRIFEPPRFFEALLRGRAHTEPPDITARICGICPVAYQMSACQAIEDACGVTVPEEIRALRRLLYAGEWIQSHALHIFLLHAPDFLGYPSVIELAREHPDVVELGLSLKKLGNRLMTVLGGRAVHPVNVRVGGFYRLPGVEDVRALVPDLTRGLDDARRTAELVAGFEFPDLEQPFEYLALEAPRPGEYPIDHGTRVVSSGGLRFPVSEFTDHVVEEHLEHSTALHARLHDRLHEPLGGYDGTYLVGPMARYALNRSALGSPARESAEAAGLEEVCRNPFRSIVVRAVELVEACDQALAIVSEWAGAPGPWVDVPARPGVGHGATEAPRGLLYHRYRLDAEGSVLDARIVPPTSQNQHAIEADLLAFVRAHPELDDAELTHRCEQAIRNYDPCISCSTHFLDLTRERT